MKADTIAVAFLGGLAVAIVLSAVLALFYGWILMLLLGVIHLNLAASVPAAGYWACVVPAFLFRVLVSSPTGSAS